jgi:hypothetical protein
VKATPIRRVRLLRDRVAFAPYVAQTTAPGTRHPALGVVMTERAQRIPCPSCEYDLRAHVTADDATCPECGSAFSRENLLDYKPEARILAYERRWKWLLIWLICTPPLVGALMMTIGIAVWFDRPPAWFQLLYFAVVLTGGVVQLAAAIWCGRKMYPPWPWWAGVCAGIILVVASVLVHFVSSLAVLMIMMNIMS